MKSQHSEKFNHDSQAHFYDKEVKNEIDPVREGYSKTLNEIIRLAEINEELEILELGSGTGNLTSKIKKCKNIVCVDLSKKMEDESKEKCKHLENKKFIQSDFLDFLTKNNSKFDLVISSYALHHLTDDEKVLFLQNAKSVLNKNGKIIIGDLMLSNRNELKIVKDKYKTRKPVYHSFIEEFYWICDEIKSRLSQEFKNIEIYQLSELSSIMMFKN